MNQESFIKELGRSYIISSLLPAAFFCLICLMLFQGFIPEDYFVDLADTNVAVLGQWLLMSIVPIWIGFLLFSSVDWVVKLFEGYYFPSFLKALLNFYNRRRLQKQAKSYYEIQEILKKPVSKRTKDDRETFKKNRDTAFQEISELEIETPLPHNLIMPTRLGNVLKASEIYPQDRYLIESIAVWPRLFSLLPPKFLGDMEEKNNHLMFLINSTFMLYIAGALCIVTSVVGNIIMACKGANFCDLINSLDLVQKGFSATSPLMYGLFSIVLFGFGYVLYRIAVNAAYDFGLFFKTGFDLYRLELIKQLNHQLPKNLEEERNLWLDISKFFNTGEQLEWDWIKLKKTPYYYHEMQKENKEKVSVSPPRDFTS